MENEQEADVHHGAPSLDLTLRKEQVELDEQPAPVPRTRTATAIMARRGETTHTSTDTGERRDADPAEGRGRGAAGRDAVVGREQDECGDIKNGSVLVGCLIAVGIGVLLAALVAAAETAVRAVTGSGIGAAAGTGRTDAVGLSGGLALLAITLVAYYCSGYGVGRMGGSNGLKQGLEVWLRAIVIALVTAAVVAVAGAESHVLQTTGGVIALVAVVAASVGMALLGWQRACAAHRKVDHTGPGR